MSTPHTARTSSNVLVRPWTAIAGVACAPLDEGAWAIRLKVRPRRAFPRHAARFQVGFSSNQEFVLEYAENISAGGVFVQTEQPMELESIVTVSLRLPGNEVPVEAKGVIVHCVSKEDAARIGKHAGIGVQFLDSSDEFREAIDKAIEHILKNG